MATQGALPRALFLRVFARFTEQHFVAFKEKLNLYRIRFYGFRFWPGLYIGLFDGRRKN